MASPCSCPIKLSFFFSRVEQMGKSLGARFYATNSRVASHRSLKSPLKQSQCMT